jgi:hypothetical protein
MNLENEEKKFLNEDLIKYDLDELIKGCIDNVTEKRMQIEYIVTQIFFLPLFL